MEFNEFCKKFENGIILLEGKREIDVASQEKLTAIGKRLAEKMPNAIFRSGNADGSDYLTLAVDVPVGDTPMVASFSVGHQQFDGQGAVDYDYTDWKVNLDYAINDTYSVGAFYTDTDQKEANWTVQGEYLGDAVGGVYLAAGF